MRKVEAYWLLTGLSLIALGLGLYVIRMEMALGLL